MYKTKHFELRELVHPAIYRDRGERAWELLREDFLRCTDALREKFGPMILNTWHSDTLVKAYGLRDSACLRPFDDPDGARYSMHKFGGAGDALFLNITAEEARKYVLSHPDEFPFINAIESGVRWFHYDGRNCKRITVFKP